MGRVQRFLVGATVAVACGALGLWTSGCNKGQQIPPGPGDPDDRPPIIVGNGGSVDLVATQADDSPTTATKWVLTAPGSNAYVHTDSNTAGHGGPVSLGVFIFSSDCDMAPLHFYNPTARIQKLTVTYALSGATRMVVLEQAVVNSDKTVQVTFDSAETPVLSANDSILEVPTWTLKSVHLDYQGTAGSNKTDCTFKGVPSADGLVVLQRHK